MSEYIELREIGQKPKTKVYGVFSKKHGDKIAEIKWFGRWRQFALFFEKGTVWNDKCLADVIQFLHKAKVEGKLEEGKKQ